VPCHIDPSPANFLASGAAPSIHLIDWEYAALGEPAWDLAGLSTEAGFGAAEDRALLAAYYGQPTAADIARFRLHRVLLRIVAASWAAAHAADAPEPESLIAMARQRVAEVHACMGAPAAQEPPRRAPFPLSRIRHIVAILTGAPLWLRGRRFSGANPTNLIRIMPAEGYEFSCRACSCRFRRFLAEDLICANSYAPLALSSASWLARPGRPTSRRSPSTPTTPSPPTGVPARPSRRRSRPPVAASSTTSRSRTGRRC